MVCGRIRKDPSAVDELIAALGESNPSTRQEIARTLGDIGDARAAESLIKTLDDKNSDVKKAALEALGSLGDVHAADLLFNKVQNNWHGYELLYAAQSLRRLKDERASELLIELCADTNLGVRRPAAEELSKLGDPVSLLIRALSDSKPLQRRRAAEALSMLDDRRAALAVMPLIEALDDTDRDVRRAAAWALGTPNSYICDVRAIEPLRNFLDRDEVPGVRDAAQSALHNLMKRLGRQQ